MIRVGHFRHLYFLKYLKNKEILFLYLLSLIFIFVISLRLVNGTGFFWFVLYLAQCPTMPCHNCVKHRDLIKHLYHDSQKDEEDLKILRNGFMISTARLATIGYLHRLERAASVAIIFSIVPNTG